MYRDRKMKVKDEREPLLVMGLEKINHSYWSGPRERADRY